MLDLCQVNCEPIRMYFLCLSQILALIKYCSKVACIRIMMLIVAVCQISDGWGLEVSELRRRRCCLTCVRRRRRRRRCRNLKKFGSTFGADTTVHDRTSLQSAGEHGGKQAVSHGIRLRLRASGRNSYCCRGNVCRKGWGPAPPRLPGRGFNALMDAGGAPHARVGTPSGQVHEFEGQC